MNKSIQTVVVVMCAFVIFGMFVYALDTASKLPDVWFSYQTQECVKVLNYAEGDNYNCENLPSRYYHVWVE